MLRRMALYGVKLEADLPIREALKGHLRRLHDCGVSRVGKVAQGRARPVLDLVLLYLWMRSTSPGKTSSHETLKSA